MTIGYSAHAAERMRERHISKREVKEALRLGLKAFARDGNRMCVYKYLVVIYEIKGLAKMKVITTYRR